MIRLISAMTAATLLPALAAADVLPGKTGVSARIGTLGLGVEASRTIPVANLTARLGYNTFTYDYDDSIDGIDYDLELDLQSVSALVDWRPWGRLTHFTAGVLYNLNEVVAFSDPTGSITIGEIVFPGDDVGTLNGTVEFDDFAPYLGVGWNVPLAPSFLLSLELGVVLQGSPRVSLTADGDLADEPQFQEQLEAERAAFEEDIEDFEYYPVLSLGFVKRF